MRYLIACAMIFCLASSAHSQNNPPHSPIIFIYDASGSMWGQINGRSKMDIATQVLTETIEKLPDTQETGLVVYGHRNKANCRDVEFMADVAKNSKATIAQVLKTIKPLGKTPLAYSATLVIDKLRQSKRASTIILITDGIESCDGNICDVIKAAKEEGIDFKLHIVGFGLKANETEQLKCAASAGEGKYLDAANADHLTAALFEATNETVDALPDNFSVYALKNNMPVDALVKAYEAGTDQVIDGARTYRDTGYMHLPGGKYDLEVIPLENTKISPIILKNIEVLDHKPTHQTVSFDGAKIQVSTLNNGNGWDALVKIIERQSDRVAAGGRTYGRAKMLEVDPGSYYIQVEAMAMSGTETKHRIDNVTVNAGETKEIEHNFKSGIAMIGASNSAGLVDATINITETTSNTAVAAGRTYTSESSNPRKFILSPGVYQVKVMALGSNGKTETFRLEVKEGQTVERTINF